MSIPDEDEDDDECLYTVEDCYGPEVDDCDAADTSW